MKNSYKILLFIAFCLAPLALNLGSLLIKPFSFSEGYFSSASKISPHVIPDDEVPFNWDVNELTKHCLVVDDLCRSPHMFFYHPDPTGRKHQPNVLFKLDSGLWFDSETVHRKFYRFLLLNESIVTPALLDQSSTCTRSPIQNHFILYGMYNNMLGEFYARSLVYLNELSKRYSWITSISTQLYLHLYHPYIGLMDSHHLFTAPWRSLHRPLRSLSDLLDDTGCTCMDRVIMCGYQIETNVVITNDTGLFPPPGQDSRPTVPGPMNGNDWNHFHSLETSPTIGSDSTTQEKKPVVEVTSIQVSHSTPSQAHRNRTVTWVRPHAAWSAFLHADLIRSDLYHDARTKLRSIITNNLVIQKDILKFRQHAFSVEGVPSQDQDHYKIVGLAQRSGRRRWKDMPIIRRVINEKFQKDDVPIVCVEMNLEMDSSQYQQVVRHGSLDGLIGIHGAQLTEAIWMRDHAWVIELLPFVPKYISHGQWTRSTGEPTPLGVIFARTSLNHAGYRLGIDSAPYCRGNMSDAECWDEERWSDRDFYTPSDLLERILLTFYHTSSNTTSISPVPLPSSPSCQYWQERAAAPDFVLYNVNCFENDNDNVTDANKNSTTLALTPHQFFWK